MPPRLHKFLSIRRWTAALERRGAAGFLSHAARRAGTYLGPPLAAPETIRINPVNAHCNHTCPMCWLQNEPAELVREARKVDHGRQLTLAEYEQIFAEMPLGLRAIEIVGGGEPLLYKEIAGICRAIKRRGWRGMLCTNATLMTDAIARDLIEAEWDCLRVSMHGGDRETYEATQGTDRFDQMKKALVRYQMWRERLDPRRHCRVTHFHVIQRGNVRTIDGLFKIGAELAADELVFHDLIAYGDAMRLTEDETRVAIDALRQGAATSTIPNNAAHLADHFEGSLRPATDGPFRPGRWCSVGYDQTFISASGAVKPCCYSDEVLGEVREEGFGKVWRGPKYRAFRKRLGSGQFAHYCLSNRCSIHEVLHE